MIRVFKFKKNDLNPSGGKQIEYSISDVKDFFQFPSGEETVEFRYTSVIPNDPLNGLRFKSTFKLSQARGDYKCYGNPDGSINLKSFFLDKLHLTPEDNLEDSYALKKLGLNSFALAYFPKGIDFTTVSQFFYSENTTTETPDSVNQPLDEPLQQIFFGAPGTGKSFKINEACAQYENYRTTFHPDTDYASFVGSYKPITEIVTKYDMHGHAYPEKRIVYTYVFQAFLKAYIAAWREQQKENPRPVFLVVEEINRGNCAQIFGDIFQLLDRNESGYSDYPIVADDDLAQELKREFENLNVANPQAINSLYLGDKDVVGCVKSGKQLLLPNNLYIWATMNTSDQSLFPIDSAFKRRWDWKYIKIKDGKKDYKIVFSNGNVYDWWSFVTEINNRIEGGEIQQEDKKLGYFFAKSKDGIITADRFLSKVIFFLYNDVFKDFGFDDDFFKGADGQPMTFASYFDEAGESNEAQIERFLNNLGLEPIDVEATDVTEEQVFGLTVNDRKIPSMTQAVFEILSEAAKSNSFEKISETINDIFKDRSDVVKAIDNPDTYTEETRWYKIPIIANEGTAFVVSNQWLKQFMPQLKELAESFNVPFEYDYDGEDEYSLVVKWPDGDVLSLPSKNDTYVKTLERIGIDRAAEGLKGRYRLKDVPVISKSKSSKVEGTIYKYVKVGDWYVLTGIDNHGSNLRLLSDTYNLGLEIEGE